MTGMIVRSGGAVFGLVFALTSLVSVPARSATVQIVIEKLVFSPAEASAKVGDTIEWVNKDILAHSATAKTAGWDVLIPPGKTARLQVKAAGRVDYFCKLHPNMKGRVTVTP